MSANKKLGFSWEEHQQLGSDLRETQRKMTELVASIGNTYNKNSKVLRKVQTAEKALRDLRSELDNLVGQEHPERTRDEIINTYF